MEQSLHSRLPSIERAPTPEMDALREGTADSHRTGVVLLYSVSRQMLKGESRDLLAEVSTARCAIALAEVLRGTGWQVAMVPLQGELESALLPYPSTEWTVFNLAEGSEGRLFEEVRLTLALEAMGYCFTGADGHALALSTHKARAKHRLTVGGVPTPAWWTFHNPDDVQSQAGDLPFPLIVKPVAEDASIGISPEAVVHSSPMLRQRVAYVTERYRQVALVEEFIAGREFNVSVWGQPPSVLPVAEIDYSAFTDPYERIVSFSAKWEEGSFEYDHTPVRCPAEISQALAGVITATALRAWDTIGCSGYARVDIRLSEEQIPYVMEVNCNPDLSPDAGFYRAARAAGFSYTKMAAHILSLATRRQTSVPS